MKKSQDQSRKDILEAALQYEVMGFSVVPIQKDKKGTCGIPWTPLQKDKADPEQIVKWFTKFPDANIAVVTGSVSGIAVIDVDKTEDRPDYPETVCSKTGGGGWHFFYKMDSEKPVPTCTGILTLTDIRGEGGLIIMPPSLHESGKNYEWVKSPDEIDFAEFPHEFFDFSKTKKGAGTLRTPSDWEDFQGKTYGKGVRNDTATSYAGKLLHQFPKNKWESDGWNEFMRFNKENIVPPLEEEELRSIWESIKKSEGARREEGKDKLTFAHQLIELVNEQEDIEFFHDETGEPYVKLLLNSSQKILRCGSDDFKRWLKNIFWQSQGKPLSREMVNTALGIIESIAVFEGKKYELSNRVSDFDGAIWYDLNNDEGSAVRIDANGWGVIPIPPILFRKESSLEDQVMPAEQGDVQELLKFINIPDKNMQILLLVWICSCFIPSIPIPALMIFGTQGSAKSTLSRFLRRIVDPSRIEVSSLCRGESEFAQLFSQNRLVIFDNISHFSEDVSDIICRLVTGSVFTKRKLYTDGETIIFDAKGCVVLNGINLLAVKPDLLERSILVELERISECDRKTERQIFASFEDALPRILGGIFTVLQKAMAIKEKFANMKDTPRMADFAEWGCALAEAIGFKHTDFLDAYYANIKQQNMQVIQENPTGMLTLEFMEKRKSWSGTATQLLQELTKLAAGMKYEVRFARSTNALSRHLNTLEVNLKQAGILKRTEKTMPKIIHLSRVQKNTYETEVPIEPVTGELFSESI